MRAYTIFIPPTAASPLPGSVAVVPQPDGSAASWRKPAVYARRRLCALMERFQYSRVLPRALLQK